MQRMIAFRSRAIADSPFCRWTNPLAHEQLDVIPGIRLIRTFAPLQLSARFAAVRRAGGDDLGLTVFRTIAKSADSYAELLDRFSDVVAATYLDLGINGCPGCNTSGTAVGSWHDVRRALGKGRATGRNVRVAVVDGGIDGQTVSVNGGWCHDTLHHFTPGGSTRGHGTMVAFDVRLAAPDCQILDHCLFTPRNRNGLVWLSDVVAHYGQLLQMLADQPGPLVVNNSWSVYDRSQDLPPGDSASYCANPRHLVNEFVEDLNAAGADVIFAAGNCGLQSPAALCGVNDRGPGNSIHGANSHPDVLTIAAVTVALDRVGGSSQGPGALSNDKPDVSAYAQFDGSRALPGSDSGTSAACGVASGVVATLRELAPPSAKSPSDIRDVLRGTCRPLSGHPQHDVGAGVLDPIAAQSAL